MLHWKSCNKNIAWHHCETTIDEEATWEESYFALEKHLAEGRIMSIGISNFNAPDLIELESVVNIMPHLLQNWGDPSHLEETLRLWCSERNILYQPYAVGRNLNRLPDTIAKKLELYGEKYSVSPYIVAHRLFLDTGAVVIPRSSSYDHLLMNIENLFKFSLLESEVREFAKYLPLAFDVQSEKIDEL